MEKVLQLLTARLERELKRRINERVDVMLREIAYLEEQENTDLHYLQRRGWTREKLQVVCCMNSFYQIVLAPLASSAREEIPEGIGEEIPILYGELRFDARRAKAIREVHTAFEHLISRAELPTDALTFNRPSDFVYRTARRLRDHESE